MSAERHASYMRMLAVYEEADPATVPEHIKARLDRVRAELAEDDRERGAEQ